MSLNLSDPIVLKAAAGGALYAFGGSRGIRMAGLALAGWAAWDYFNAPKQPALRSVPLDPDAPMPLTGAQSIRAPGPLFPGADPGPQSQPAGDDGGGKVIPFPQLTAQERAAFYGIEEANDDAR